MDCEGTHDEDHEIQQVGPLKADDVNVPSFESAQESPETHNVRRQKEIAEAGEHLLGSVMTVGCDGTLKPIDITEKRLPSTCIRQVSNQHVEDEMINDSMPSKTSKPSGVTSKHFSDVGLEFQSLFHRPKPAKVQLLIPSAPGSLVEGPPGQGSVPPTLKDHLKLKSDNAPPSNGSSTSRGEIDLAVFSLDEELRRSEEAFFNRPPSAGSNHDNAADADRNDGIAADDINAGRETQDEKDLVQNAENVQDLGDSASTLSLSSQAAAAEDVDDGKLAFQDEEAVSHNPSTKILTPPDGIQQCIQ